jgi:hypothetical protein
VDDLAVDYWVTIPHLMKGIRILDRFRHQVTTFPTIPECVLDNAYTVFTANTSLDNPNRLVMRGLRNRNTPDFRGDILMVKHDTIQLDAVVDMEESDYSLANVIIRW